MTSPSDILRNDLTKYLASRVIPGTVAFCSFLLMIRTLPSIEIGMYVLTTTSVGLVLIVFAEWLKAYLTRYLAEDFKRREWRDLISRYVGFINLLTISVVAMFFVGFYRGYFELSIAFHILAGALLFCAKLQYELKLAVLNATLNAGRYLKQRLLRNSLQLTLFILLVVCEVQAAVWFLFGLASSYLIASAVNNSVLRISLLGDWRFGLANRKMLRKAFIFGLPVSLSLTTDWIINASDKFLLSMFAAIEEVGTYASFSELLLQGLTMIFVIPYLAIYPRLVLKKSQDRGSTVKLYGFYGSLMLVGAYSLVLMGYVFPQSLGVIIWGAEFNIVGAELVPLLVVAICLFGLKAFLIDPIFHLCERTSWLMGIALIMAAANILLGVWLIPLLGVKGAALSSLIAFGLGLFFSLTVALFLDSKMVRTAIGNALPAVLMLGVIHFFTADLGLAGFLIFLSCSLTTLSYLLINNLSLLELP